MELITGIILADVISLFILITVVVYTYFQWMFQFWKRKNVPYFEPKFPFGNRYYSKKDSSITEDISECVEKAKRRGWKYFGFYLSAKPFFVPLDLEVLKCILTKDFNHFTDRGFYYNEKDDPISAHLFSIGGIKWKNLRVKLSPAFSSGKLRLMFHILTDCAAFLEKALMDHISAEPIDIKHFLACFSIDVIGSFAFGLECNSFKEPNSPFLEYGIKSFKITFWQEIIAIFENTFPDISRKLHLKAVPSDISKFYFNIVNKSVKFREENGSFRHDFLQILIDMKNNKHQSVEVKDHDMVLTIEEIVAQCFIFFLGGFETSSTTMTFALFELARQTEIQEKARKELFEVLGKYENKICYDAVNQLDFMQQIIDETLRKYPPIPFITRECVEDYQVRNTDVTLEKGTAIMIPTKSLHYDEDIFENPDEFNPERFTSKKKQSRHQYAYLPFGEGPRICIGMRFGLMQTKVGLATILRNFRVKLNPRTEVPLKMDPDLFVPCVKNGIWLNLEKI